MLINKDVSSLFLIDIQVKLTPLVHESTRLIAKCRWLQQLAQALSIPIFLSEQYPAGLGSTIAELQPETESIISKTAFSCMQEPAFINQLSNNSRQHCILAGIETHVCILQTALEMREAGLDVYVVVDAVSSRHLLDHQYALKRMQQEKIQLVTTEMVFFEWLRDSAHPDFKILSKQFLQ